MRFRNTTSGGPDERAFIPLDSQLSDHERFKDASPFLLQCRGCKGLLSFAPLHDREVRCFWISIRRMLMLNAS
jgi:DNA polymerase alpha subunit A